MMNKFYKIIIKHLIIVVTMLTTFGMGFLNEEVTTVDTGILTTDFKVANTCILIVNNMLIYISFYRLRTIKPIEICLGAMILLFGLTCIVIAGIGSRFVLIYLFITEATSILIALLSFKDTKVVRL